MVFYEVSVEVRADLAPAFEQYMRDKHLPEIMATGCFVTIRFDQATETLYRICYQAETQEDYERYLSEHAADMRFDFMQHFPEGCTPSRLVFNDMFTLKRVEKTEEKFF